MYSHLSARRYAQLRDLILEFSDWRGRWAGHLQQYLKEYCATKSTSPSEGDPLRDNTNLGGNQVILTKEEGKEEGKEKGKGNDFMLTLYSSTNLH